MTRLEILCIAHKVQGGTIHQYNQMYDEDFLSLTSFEFQSFVNDLNTDIRYCFEHEKWEEK